MLKNHIEVLKSVPLFMGIEELEIESILKCLNASIKNYKKNSIILMAGNKISFVGVILSGQIQVIKEDIFGNKTILTQLEKGDIFGETFACAGIINCPVSVISTTDCVILFIDYKKIITTCSSTCSFHTKLIENMLKIIANKSIFLNQKIEFLSKRTTREKLMSYFLSEIDKSKSTSFTIPFKRNELADFLCVDRSAMSRELCKMRDEKLIEFNKNTFVIL